MPDSPEPAICVAIIGPPHSGKSSLLHLLDELLQNHPHAPLACVIKGQPDGDTGHYRARTTTPPPREKGTFIPGVTLETILHWLHNANQFLEIALLDMGGSRKEGGPREGNGKLFEKCTHYLVLARPADANKNEDEAEIGLEAWAADAEAAGLRPFAKLRSRIHEGTPYFDPETGTGTFRGDAAAPKDTLNLSLGEQLAERLIALIPRRRPDFGYIDLHERVRWREQDLPALAGMRDKLAERVRSTHDVLLGGRAPIFAHAAGLHHTLDVEREARVRVFDPKVQGGIVPILPPRSGEFPSELLSFQWRSGDGLTLKLAAAPDDKFLPPEVVDALPALKIPEPPVPIMGQAVIIDGSGPIWLHLTLSYWMRLRGAVRVGHWDAELGRSVIVWPLAGRAEPGKF